MTSKKQSAPGGSPKPYVDKLNRAKELREAGTAKLHERVKLLVEVFEDRGWREDIGFQLGSDIDEQTLAEVLDTYLDDFAGIFNFLQFRAILATFPGIDVWQSRSLSDLWDDVRSASPSAADKPRRRWSATRADFEALERQVKRLKEQVKQLKEENRLLRKAQAVAA